ncbi:MAG: amidohydrolase family protein [Actinomycetota bacterium]
MLDLVIANASIVDGSGAEPFAGWIGVRGDRIVAVERTGNVPGAARLIDAGGATLAPGFVDVHNHSDLSPFVLPAMPSTIRQGVTSVVVGNCGSSPWPLAGWDGSVSLAYAEPDDHPRPAWTTWSDFLDAIDDAQPAVNVAALVGHGTVRQEVMGQAAGEPSPDALEQMTRLVRDAVARGAVGVSTGLIYVPGIHSGTEEIVAVAAAAAAEGGLYASHIRGEGRDLFPAVNEAIRVGERASIDVHISHLKCESSRVWGRASGLLETIRAAGATGDQYPYAAWNSSLASLLPPWAPLAHVASIAHGDGQRLRQAVEDGEPGFQSSVDGVGWDKIVISQTADARYQGLSLTGVADALACEPFDALVMLLTEDPDTACIGHAMHRDDVTTILTDTGVFVASDASAIDPTSPAGSFAVHPRDYGTFPRALEACRDADLLPLEAVVRKMTSLPAERFGLTDRGRSVGGAFADLVLFVPNDVRDVATYTAPHAFPEGISTVIVNGSVAWEWRRDDIARAGRALRRT